MTYEDEVAFMGGRSNGMLLECGQNPRTEVCPGLTAPWRIAAGSPLAVGVLIPREKAAHILSFPTAHIDFTQAGVLSLRTKPKDLCCFDGARQV